MEKKTRLHADVLSRYFSIELRKNVAVSPKATDSIALSSCPRLDRFRKAVTFSGNRARSGGAFAVLYSERIQG